MFIRKLRKNLRRVISVWMATMLLLASVVCGITTTAGQAGESFPIGFENGSIPITRVSNYYSNADHLTAEGVSLLTGSSALNGEASLQIQVRTGNTYTETEKLTMAGLPDFSKKSFDTVTGIMVRLRLNNDTQVSSHPFSIVLSQEGLTHSTYLAKDAVAYDTEGNALQVSSSNLKMTLPAGFDGFLFLPLESARSEKQTRKGVYDQYSTFPANMVDLAESFALAVRLDNRNWGGVEVIVDDISVYSGAETENHLLHLKKLGYAIQAETPEGETAGPYLPAAAQPSRYDFPLNFEDGINPFVQITDIINWTPVAHSGDIGMVGEGKALIGLSSLEVWKPKENCNRIDLSTAAMNGMEDFSKTDFTAVTGIMLRIKLAGGDKNTVKYFTLSATQSGVSRPTHLGKGAAGYDLTGKPVTLTNCNLGIKLPGDFDGYLFLPFRTAQSETVTVAGTYDGYVDHPESMVDFSENYNLQPMLKDNWGGTSLYLDDLQVYSGDEHINFLKSRYPGITYVQQPDRYSFPLLFDDGISPFNGVDDVYDWQSHKHSGGVGLTGESPLCGTASVLVEPMRPGNNRTDLNEAKMAPVEGFSKTAFTDATGIMLRLKLNGGNAEGKYRFSITATQSGVSKRTCLGKGAAGYDLTGKPVTLYGGNLGINLPGDFDGYLFLPFRTAQSETVTVAGTYDSYVDHPESMVDFSKDYSMTVMFFDDWGGISVLMDDMRVYSGNEHINYLKALYSGITYVQQPERYAFPLTFDDGLMPFNAVNDIYDWQIHWKNTGVGLTASNALCGTASVQVEALRAGNNRTDLNDVKMQGIAGFSKTDFGQVTGIMLRIKLSGGDPSAKKHLRIAARQSGIQKDTILGKGASGYDLKGDSVMLYGGNLGVSLPGDFDGYLFLPFRSAQSETVTVAGTYDSYADYPDSMVDFSKDYTMTVSFWDKWDDTVVCLDDLRIYAGNEHVNILKSLYAGITNTQQPERYSFPLVFDDGLMPFNAIDDVYNWQLHWRTDGIGLVKGSEALSGTASVKVDPLRPGNNRTDLNDVKMQGIAGFSKTDFSRVTGVMLRIRLSGGDASAQKHFRIAARQDGLQKDTFLGKGAAAYDLEGNTVALTGGNLGIKLPGNFDGYLFLPFKTAQSETVTVAGTYDSYVDYPENLVDFSKNYIMTVSFWGEWDNTAVYLDDMRIYSGDKHITLLKSLYKGIKTVQQPEYYGLPIAFDKGMTPFTFDMDGGKYAQNGVYGTGGKLSYGKNSIGTGLTIRFADDLTDAYSVYTSKAKVKIPAGALGIMLRVKTNAAESATIGVVADNWAPTSLQFGKNALLYDLEGNAVEKPFESRHWLGCNLSEEFNGFVFIPFDAGFNEKQQKYYREATGLKLDDKIVDLQMIFYGEEIWAGKTFEVEYFGVYTDKNYVGTIEKLGYELDVEKGLSRNDILGEAAKMFFYTQRLNEGFDEKNLQKLKNWTLLDITDEKLLNSYSPENIAIGNGLLTLKYAKAPKDGKAYTAGAIRTKEKFSYGYYEANLSFPKLAGTRPVFRLVTDGGYDEGGTSFEVDIAALDEAYALITGYRYMSDYKPLRDGGTVADGTEKVNVKDTFYGTGHTYGLLYTYNYLRFYVDGVLVREIENTFARGGVYAEIAGTVVSEITEPLTADNSELTIDYVRYWEIDPDEMAKYDVEPCLEKTEEKKDTEVVTVDKTSVPLMVAAGVMGAAALAAVVLLAVMLFGKKRQNADGK